MDSIQQWAVGICLTVLINAIVHYIIPSGSMEKMLRLVLGVFVLCGILLPLAKTLPNANWDFVPPKTATQDYGEFKDEVEQQIFDQANGKVRQVVIAELEKAGLPWKNVAVTMDTNEDNCIVIDQVIVTMDKEALVKAGELQTQLEKTLGLKTEVVMDGESG